MPLITLLALGPDNPKLLTGDARATLLSGGALLLRTGQHGVAQYLRGQSIPFQTLDALYDECEDFDELCEMASERIIDFARKNGGCVYAVSDPTSDQTVHALINALPQDMTLHGLSGVTLTALAATAAQTLGADTRNLRTLDALSCISEPADVRVQELSPDPTQPLMITELDSRMLASDVKLWLMRLYPAEAEIYFFPPGNDTHKTVYKLLLYQIDQQNKYDHTCALLIPAMPFTARERYTLGDLLHIMQILCAPDGCAWDKAQTHESLRPFLIEEACEACEAIDDGDPLKLCDELGDVLFQVAFHATIARKHADFDMDDVTTAICAKMIKRHEHVFAGAKLSTPEQISQNWDRIKREERGETTRAQSMQALSKSLPALLRASKIQAKAAKAGTAQLSADHALQQIINTLQALPASSDKETLMGDVLFDLVALARIYSIPCENALMRKNASYISTFEG